MIWDVMSTASRNVSSSNKPKRSECASLKWDLAVGILGMLLKVSGNFNIAQSSTSSSYNEQKLCERTLKVYLCFLYLSKASFRYSRNTSGLLL